MAIWCIHISSVNLHDVLTRPRTTWTTQIAFEMDASYYATTRTPHCLPCCLVWTINGAVCTNSAEVEHRGRAAKTLARGDNRRAVAYTHRHFIDGRDFVFLRCLVKPPARGAKPA